MWTMFFEISVFEARYKNATEHVDIIDHNGLKAAPCQRKQS